MGNRVHPQWKPFGNEIRRLRVQAGLSQAEVGARLQLSGGMIGHLERAARIANRQQVDALENLFATNGELLRQWTETLDDRKVPDWFKDVLVMERRSDEIREYQPILIPGLLQTSDYARVLITARQIRATKEQVDEVVKVRTERLPNIAPNAPALWFVVDEIAVTRVVGDKKIMRDQLGRIVSLAESGTIRFQVIPTEVRRHCGLCSPLRVMTLRGGSKVVHMEHMLGGATFDKPESVEPVLSLFGALQAEALSPGRSTDLIQKVIGEL